MNIIEVENLRKRFNLEAGFFAKYGQFIYAVNGVSVNIGEYETYGLVGESGCGKSTTARLLVRMYEADEGSIRFHRDGGTAGGCFENVRQLKGKELKTYREKVKYVFQDPARSLNPRQSVYQVLTSGKRYAGVNNALGKAGSKAVKLREEAGKILEEVGLSRADLDRRPAEFSGGQRQRISIARGLIMNPELLICDEVVSALDVSIQGQILNQLLDIRERRAAQGRPLSFLFIAHDLKVSCYFCDRIGVMYRGQLMEEAPAASLYKDAVHPYTKLLFQSAPGMNYTKPEGEADRDAARLQAQEKVPDLADSEVSAVRTIEKACPFADRCPLLEKRCREENPAWREITPGHWARCFSI
jgi:oligopeptide/dipeptide ABC transporter ATP-binding protein